MDQVFGNLALQDTITAEPYIEIEGGVSLRGDISLAGAKNSALPSIVAACLSSDEVVLHNVPVEINDVRLLIELLIEAGAKIEIHQNSLICCGSGWKGGALDELVAGKIRHSLLLLGASAFWGSSLFLPLPGGCSIGSRKHDLHVLAFKAMGFDMIENEMGLLLNESRINKESNIVFHYPTFGGTINAIFAGVRGNGTKVTIYNAACNPEVIDVINLLNKMGAQIRWVNNNALEIIGVPALRGTVHNIMPDRIIAATLISATGITKGNVNIHNISGEVLAAELTTWRKTGLQIDETTYGLTVRWTKRLQPVDVVTSAYPGFHTDIQPLHTALMLLSDGTSTLTETILDGRFEYCYQLAKMGANIEIVPGNFNCVNGAAGQIAIIKGVDRLKGSDVVATDIRGGAAVAVAALAAEGNTKITNIYQIERGYGNIIDLFGSLGANIKRVSESK
ncbi:UDP-N-acetylglucosamine 1-carboxyvinyltransferase [Paenibacillus lycopersici]|uniref:UDP-N-acetylglucosamine 1-carboxyvinyltransferase n=1 Tax=Paenibacillus lycopersici TaxID=2704462 RepID=A0A6C0FWS0_9BACL|nr:UDP-N-acetylglucosamine 1-carboxyvinyltransferase [Paenibacillus lycopersici]QHT59921.1 UDP-N-acetylglucosamine 1-carboxyvinyltransferase [Paenibacillus lycopersici]